MTDRRYMLRALALARRGGNGTAPNPNVGAVVVDDRGRIHGQGWHRRAGEAHAEVLALRDAGSSARGATLYLTLEPCNHTGKTPPCTETILASGIRRVVFASRDPNPHVLGRGGERLRREGVEVVEGVLGELGDGLIAPWKKWVTSGKPFVTLKLALSRDGKIARGVGERTAITGAISNSFVQRLRGHVHGIAIGAGTVAIDRPVLTNRSGKGANPQRIVFDSTLRSDISGELFQTAREIPTVIFTTDRAEERVFEQFTELGVKVCRVSTSRGRVAIADALQILGESGVYHLLCEGGATLGESFLRAGEVDQIFLLRSEVTFGPSGVPFLPGGEDLADFGFTRRFLTPIGRDSMEHLVTLPPAIC